ncbi:MAG: class I SAM-dependent methyltransferase [Ruminococcus sp.]|nr:class I SAM-dependent methyltransferase [Ruminococcus sp.]
MPYSVFARYYDELTANINYKKRAEYFHEIIKRFNVTDNNILLDLACGTGSISFEMSELGYDVIGVDNSDEMLGIALDKKFDNNLNVQFLCQDMRSFEMFGTIGVTLCVLDSLNHLGSIDDVRKVFERTALFAEPDGLFIFDMNTEYKHKNILSQNIFIYETENVYCVWENELNEESLEVKINLEFFEREENGLYSRSSESFSERAYSRESIERILKDTGFELLAEYGDDSFENPKEDTQRIIYVARNKNTHQLLS